jgi:hypothetical protein
LGKIKTMEVLQKKITPDPLPALSANKTIAFGRFY